MPTNFGNLPKDVERQGASSTKVSQYWQDASMAGKVPNLKKVATATARCEEFLSMYITYISVSKSTPLAVTGPHGQLASYIFPSFPSFRLPPASADGPTNLIFSMRMELEYGLTLFGKLGS